MYAVLKNKKLKPIEIIAETKIQQKKSNWFFDLFVSLTFGLISFAFEIFITSILGPIGGMLAGVVGDISASILSDLILGRDPFSRENLIFTILTTSITVPGRIRGISRIKKNKINILSEIFDNDDFSKLAKEFNKINLNDTNKLNVFERKYNKILQKYNLTEEIFNYTSNVSRFKNFNKKQIKFKDFLNKSERTIRFFNKKINLIDPEFAAKELTEFLLKKPKSFINKKITYFQKSLVKKFGFKAKERVRDILIPLNHISAPWILGIRLIPVHNAINYYHVIIVFDKKLTNDKKQIILFNKPWKNIKKFIESPSSGQYYINNVCWGWDIGRLIRNNIKGLNIVKKSFNLLPLLSRTFYQTFSILNSSIELINTLKEIDKKIENLSGDVVKGFIRGTTSKLKGFTFVNSFVRSLEKKQSRYLIQTTVRKLTKNYKKISNNISINRIKKIS